MSEEVDLGRRRFLGAAAMMIAAAQFNGAGSEKACALTTGSRQSGVILDKIKRRKQLAATETQDFTAPPSSSFNNLARRKPAKASCRSTTGRSRR
jgi:hypothetical protein